MGDRAAAIKFFNAGVAANADRTNLTHSYQMFMSACYADPTYAHAFYFTGNANYELKHDPAAIACYRRALEGEDTEGDRGPCLVNLGWRLYETGHLNEALEVAQAAVDLDPKLAYGWGSLSRIHLALNQTETAVSCAMKAVECGPDDPISEFSLAFALLFNHQFAEGLKAFEARFSARLTQYNHYPYPKWKGEKGKTLFLVADQGLGDTLSFARFVDAAAQRCQYVHACIQPELSRAFSHAFVKHKNINWIPSRSVNFPQADYWSTFVSLPYALGLADDEIRNAPDIDMPRYSLPGQWKVPDRRLHIGIAWAGSTLNDIDRHRNVPIEQFLDLYRVPGIQLYGLQVDGKRDELHENGCAAVIKDLSPYIHDVVDTVAILKDLDFVITIESALGHICASVGKECWIPYSRFGKDYRIGIDGTDRLWTPHHRIFSQGMDEPTWQPTFDRITQAVRERISGI